MKGGEGVPPLSLGGACIEKRRGGPIENHLTLHPPRKDTSKKIYSSKIRCTISLHIS